MADEKMELHCAEHGTEEWQGDIVCDACGQVFQTKDEAAPRYAPEVCLCGLRLMPTKRAFLEFTGRPVCSGCATKAWS